MPALRNNHHEQFAQALAAGAAPWEAYCRYRPNAAKSTANSAGYKLAKKPEIAARIIEIQQGTAVALDQTRVATKQRLLEMLTDVIFTPVSDLDETSPLVQEVTQDTLRTGGKRGKLKKGTEPEGNEEEEPVVIRTRVKMVSKAFAVKQLALMMGFNAPLKMEGEIRVKGLSEFIKSIRRPGLPRERAQVRR